MDRTIIVDQLAAVERSEQCLTLLEELHSLPAQYREPLVLYYREQQSIERVAQSLELTEDTVRQRLSRGRKLLQKALWEVATDAGLVPATSEDEG